jgi:membrane-associated phospholipid phosphatase
MASPEGSPVHPSYPSGHATFVGAGVTVLKALFDENFVIPNPVQPSDDGMSLVPWAGAPLTVGNELNKLASNIAIGRNFAGFHYRSDATGGNTLGEQVAIGTLRDLDATMFEEFAGFSFTKFDGTRVIVKY